MKDIMERALEAQRTGLVLDASVFAGFPMADIPYVGFTVVIVAGDNLHPCRAAAKRPDENGLGTSARFCL